MLIARTPRIPFVAPAVTAGRFPAGPRIVASAEPRARLNAEGEASSTLELQLPNRQAMTLKDLVLSINVEGAREGEQLYGYLTAPYGFGVTFPLKSANGVDRTYTMGDDFRNFFKDLPANGEWELAIVGPRGSMARFNSWAIAAYGETA